MVIYIYCQNFIVVLAEQKIEMHANQILDPISHQVLDPGLNTPEIQRNDKIKPLLQSKLRLYIHFEC